MINLSKEMMGAAGIPLILSVLEEGESYGYLIIQRIREISGGTLEWKEGTLYPILHKMERKGLIRSYRKVSDSGRERKYYELVDQGRAVLAEEKLNWLSLNEIFSTLWIPRTKLI